VWPTRTLPSSLTAAVSISVSAASGVGGRVTMPVAGV
jgi:hypothetical protein